MNNVEEQIISIINKIRPFLISDGGDVKYIKFENGIVYVKLLGHCSNCTIMDTTLKDVIEMSLINEIPEVIEVINIDSFE